MGNAVCPTEGHSVLLPVKADNSIYKSVFFTEGQHLLGFPYRTFWVATSIAGCQGSWVREALQEGCACPPPAFIFV